jgi:hypothetical protein
MTVDVIKKQVPRGGSYQHVRGLCGAKETIDKFQDGERGWIKGTLSAD